MNSPSTTTFFYSAPNALVLELLHCPYIHKAQVRSVIHVLNITNIQYRPFLGEMYDLCANISGDVKYIWGMILPTSYASPRIRGVMRIKVALCRLRPLLSALLPEALGAFTVTRAAFRECRASVAGHSPYARSRSPCLGNRSLNAGNHSPNQFSRISFINHHFLIQILK